MNQRFVIYLAACFSITWIAWGVLVLMTREFGLNYGTPMFMSLFILGGFGPTIAAYVSVIATRRQVPVREFNHRLLRWRVPIIWYLFAFGFPLALGAIAASISPTAPSIKPWYMVFPLFGMMVIGGGLEELGWRGIGQAELEHACQPLQSALLIAPIWLVWHLPLFVIPGTSQFGSDLLLFAVGLFSHALLLGGLYHHTRSILLCIIFHAASNCAAALGLSIPDNAGWAALVSPMLGGLIGFALLQRWVPRKARPGTIPPGNS